ncbi:CheY-like protein [Calocera viscosa TUFC12733]|uniref:CheY-like protein n=1 Tax=Calocera viscosa (strain TUFC12733) TaxID=1330018 RepID=A0A167GVU1_CALVF|nr:CheY-like protein [Calocera viscosa TUFC12733]
MVRYTCDPLRRKLVPHTAIVLHLLSLLGASHLRHCRQHHPRHHLQLLPPYQNHRHPNILLIEDNIVNQKLGIRLLQKLSHRCDVAENGKVALDMLKANEDRYSLILMDCQMPIMNGFECTRQIRSLESSGVRQGRLPIIALTANVSSESREECQKAGADFFLPKPLLLQDLKDTLNQFVAPGA